MVFYCAVILVILASESSATIRDDEHTSMALRAGDLAQLLINEDTTSKKSEEGRAQNLVISTDEDHKAILERVLTLLQKGQKYPNDVRIHVIKNPEVLEEYKQSLRANKHNSLASENLSDLSSLGEADYSEKSKENTHFRGMENRSLRRNAVFRLGDRYDDSNERNSGENPNISGRIEDFPSKGDVKLKEDKNHKTIDGFDAESNKKLGNHNNKDYDVELPKKISENRRDRQRNEKNPPRHNKKSKETWEETHPIVKKLDSWIKPLSSERFNKKSRERKDTKVKNIEYSNEKFIKDNFKPHKSDWAVKEDKYFKKDAQTTYGMPTYRTTRERRKAKIMPHLSEYQSKAKKYDIARSPVKGFGRTYIPFDRKKGIYAE